MYEIYVLGMFVDLLKNSGYNELEVLSELLRLSDNPEMGLLKLGYMGRASRLINSKLRCHKLSLEDKALFLKIEQALNFALEQCERYNNKKVFRDESRIFTTAQIGYVLDWFNRRKGKIICYPAFVSTYSNKKRIPSGYPLLLEILTSTNSKAYDLSSIKPDHPEQEVLFKSKSCFEIIGVDAINNIVTLNESKLKPDITVYNNQEYFSILNKFNSTTNSYHIDDI